MRIATCAATCFGFGLVALVACGGSGNADVLGGENADGGSPDGATPIDGSQPGDASGDVATDTGCPDKDGDGVTVCAGDCDDNDPNNFPGNVETCGDAKDNNCAGGADEACGGLGTFVSGDKGNDANPGTQAMPVKTIAKGMANAKTIGLPRTVFVAGAHYPEDVDIVEGLSLSGGFLCAAASCTWARDPKANDTAILDQRVQGVIAGATITSATKLDGFRIQGQDASGAVAMTCDGGSPTISNNVINGGTIGNNAVRTIGLAILGPTNEQAKGAIVDKNTITGGAAGNNTSTAAIVLSRPGGPPAGNPAAATITSNTITGGAVGSGAISLGIFIAVNGTSASTRITGNTIEAGTSAVGSRTWGIRTSGPGTVNANRINPNRASGATCASAGNEICGGGIESAGSTTTITNNVVFGVRGNSTVALHASDNESVVGAIVVNANYLDGGGDGSAASQSAAVALRLNAGNAGVIGSFRNNILMGGLNINRFGMLEELTPTKTCHPQSLDHNDFFFSVQGGRTDAVYRYSDGVTVTSYTLAQLQSSALTTPAPASNLNVDCLFTAATGVLGATSPCGNAGTPTEAPPKDLQGDPRPKSAVIDIGPDEAL